MKPHIIKPESNHMPKIHAATMQDDNAAFMADLNAITAKATRKSQRENKAREQNASPEYWRKQRHNMRNNMNSWHELTPWIAA
jgi:hypothetical protein